MQFLLSVAGPPAASGISPWILVAGLFLAVGGGLVGWVARKAVERAALRDLDAYQSEVTRASNCARDRALAEKQEIEERYTRLHREHADCTTSISGIQARIRERDATLESLELRLSGAQKDIERKDGEIRELKQRLIDFETAVEDRARRDGTPEWLLGAPDGPKDALTAIRGLGPIMEQRLNELGVFHFSQLARMTEENARWFAMRLGVVPGRLTRDRWAEQARSLQSGSD
jgi:predicted flap endonuclease-1-like 5' DNA nuclease